MKTVNELYNQAKKGNLKLLSEHNAIYWNDYIVNHEKYDKLFNRLFSSFFYAFDEDNNLVQSLSQFIDDVEAHLLLNDKKYSELYRINVIDDNNYSLTNNYDMTEIMARTNNEQAAQTSGQRSDINNSQIGSQNVGTVNKVTAFNSANENTSTSGTSTNGTRNDISQFTKGQQTDTEQSQSSENYTLTRKGNIGVMTATDMLDKHKTFWSIWEFYEMIFNDICAELLEVYDDGTY